MKYIVVSGGVVSGLGKGVTISSIGRMLQGCGLRVTSIKIDPYLNVDAGTMSPFEHGEVFVLNDGAEADLDLGNYERFLGISLTADHNITTGKVYRNVISRERKGDYLGKTVQVVPHITNEIQDWIERVAQIPVDGSGKAADICLIEVGGTVGDIESSVFLEALRQFQFRVGNDNFCLMFVSLVPVLGVVGEQKTKPTQHGVKELRSLGLSPAVIFCRSKEPLEECTRKKISGFCHVPPENVLSVHDVNNIYHVPILLAAHNLHRIIAGCLKINNMPEEPQIDEWKRMAHAVDNMKVKVKIAMVGKYTGLTDSYLSVIKALKHATIACDRDLEIVWVDSSHLEKTSATIETNVDGINKPGSDTPPPPSQAEHNKAWLDLRSAHGVLVPGGFGNRGFKGMTLAAEYARTNNIPYFGICLGFQAMVVEYVRNVLKLPDCNSTEFDEDCKTPCIIFMPEIDKENMGGTMRLGSRDTAFIQPQHTSISQRLHKNKTIISERHRHRYEVNPDIVQKVDDAGLKFVGKDAETKTRMEIAELKSSLPQGEVYHVGAQYHPEFQSRPMDPSPLFLGLIMASIGTLKKWLEENPAGSSTVEIRAPPQSVDAEPMAQKVSIKVDQ